MCLYECKVFQEKMSTFLDREWGDVDATCITKELRKRQNMLFTFMQHKDVPWHNNDAERAIRQGILHRKISGGRRTWAGFEFILNNTQ